MADKTHSLKGEISDKIAVATTTLYRPGSKSDACRAELAKDLIHRCTERGYIVTVVDGGSSDELLREFEYLGARLSVQEGKSMGAGRRQAIKMAFDTGREVIAWTEPEKTSYIDDIVRTAEPLLADSADLVVPRRRTMYSYPDAQQRAESMGNGFWKDLTGHDLDVWFGPRTWRREMSEYFLSYDGRYGDRWDSIFIPVMDIILDGKKVTEVVVDYVHPSEQREIEDDSPEFYSKRLEQLKNIMTALGTHWRKNAVSKLDLK